MPSITKYDKAAESSNPALPGRYSIVDAYIEKADGSTFDLFSKLARFNVYESIHTMWLSADFDIIDTSNLPKIAKLSGGEKIFVKTTDMRGEARNYEFILTAITNKQPKSASSWSYKIHAVTENYFRAHLDLVSKSFVNKRPEQIIGRLLTDEMGFDTNRFFYAESAKNTCCIIPSWRATFAAKWLVTRAESEQFDQSPWRLFMDINQDIYFVPLKLLYKSDYAREKSLYFQGNRKVEDLISSRVLEHEFMFERLELSDSISAISNLRDGLYVSEVESIDLANRLQTSTTYNYADEFNEDDHLGNQPAEIDGFDVVSPHYRTATSHLGLFSQDSSEDRNPVLSSIYDSKNQQTKLLTIRGVLPASNRLRVGQKYKLDFPDYSDRRLDSPDERISGDFLMETIKHSYGADSQYRAIVQMYRDAFTRTS